MFRFSVGQEWITENGTLHGEVIEISDDGHKGQLLITDDKENVTLWEGTAAELRLGVWRPVT
jgi:hypothetical protein